MKLDVSAFETTDYAFAVAEEPGFGFGQSLEGRACAAGGTGVGVVRTCVVVESSKDDNLLAGHEHEILWLCGGIVDEGSAGADAPLLKGKAGPGVEGVRVHGDECGRGARKSESVRGGARR